ncbi:MAG: hypothetical protein HQK49_09955 [Oligoflexia bacterium]|nr:hypothetical protein [Oligoflexia bacterium]
MSILIKIFGLKENDEDNLINLKTKVFLDKRIFGRFTFDESKYPLKAMISNGEKEIACKIINISEEGMLIEFTDKIDLLQSTSTSTSNNITLILNDQTHTFEFTPIHNTDLLSWGIKLKLLQMDKIDQYFSLISPIVIGKNFMELNRNATNQTSEHIEIKKRIFTSVKDATITIWVKEDNWDYPLSFEFLYEKICIRKSNNKNEIEYLQIDEGRVDNAGTKFIQFTGKIGNEDKKQLKNYFKNILINTSDKISPLIVSNLIKLIESFTEPSTN